MINKVTSRLDIAPLGGLSGCARGKKGVLGTAPRTGQSSVLLVAHCVTVSSVFCVGLMIQNQNRVLSRRN